MKKPLALSLLCATLLAAVFIPAPASSLFGNHFRPFGPCLNNRDWSAEPTFNRWDSNNDDRFNISDVMTTLRYLFLGGGLHCEDAADVNDDGRLNLTDVMLSLQVLFGGMSPGDACGFCGNCDFLRSLGDCGHPDYTFDDLECQVEACDPCWMRVCDEAGCRWVTCPVPD